MNRLSGTVLIKALSPDDVVLLPQYSDILTRKTVDLSQTLFENTHRKFQLLYPILSSNMDTITEYETAKAMSKAGAVKVLAAGADIVMSGSLFAGCKETPCLENGRRGYRGMASREARQAFYGKDYQQVPEGESFMDIPEQGSVGSVVEELVMAIKSGLSYSGASNLEQLHQKATFYEVTYSGHVEGTPHFRLKL